MSEKLIRNHMSYLKAQYMATSELQFDADKIMYKSLLGPRVAASKILSCSAGTFSFWKALRCHCGNNESMQVEETAFLYYVMKADVTVRNTAHGSAELELIRKHGKTKTKLRFAFANS